MCSASSPGCHPAGLVTARHVEGGPLFSESPADRAVARAHPAKVSVLLLGAGRALQQRAPSARRVTAGGRRDCLQRHNIRQEELHREQI